MNWERTSRNELGPEASAGAGIQHKLLQDSVVNLDKLEPSAPKFQIAGILDFWKPRGGGSDAESELAKGPPPLSSLKEGDIIFHTSQTEQSKFIRQATHSPLSHCGILFKEKVREKGKEREQWYVYEAENPVQKTRLEDFAKRGENHSYVVRRLSDESSLTSESLSNMKQYLDREVRKRTSYDSKFGWGDDKLYCSELVWKAYNQATGKRIGEPKQMKDYDLSDPLLRKKMEDRWGKKLPLNELMIGPSDVYESRLLKTVR